jgi:hypothetical protein
MKLGDWNPVGVQLQRTLMGQYVSFQMQIWYQLTLFCSLLFTPAVAYG